MITGSRQWCQYWANWYWNRAIKHANRNGKYPMDDHNAMEFMFMSYMWEDTEPWA